MIVGCFNVLLTVDDPDLLDEPVGFVLLICGVFLAFGPLLLVIALWSVVEQIQYNNRH